MRLSFAPRRLLRFFLAVVLLKSAISLKVMVDSTRKQHHSDKRLAGQRRRPTSLIASVKSTVSGLAHTLLNPASTGINNGGSMFGSSELDHSELVVLRTYPTIIDAELAKTALESVGIDSMVRSDNEGGQSLGLAFARGVELL